MIKFYRPFAVLKRAATLLLIAIVSSNANLACADPGNDAFAALKALVQRAPTTAVGQSATLLPDGRWLLLGGENAQQRATAVAVLRDLRSESTVPLPNSLTYARSGHTATLLPYGYVLIIGGTGEDGKVVATSELFNLQTQEFSTVSLGLLPRTDHTATLLTDGRLLIAGGVSATGQVMNDVEVLDTFSGQIERFDAQLETARFGHLATLLPSAPVLVTGGYGADNQPVATAELYDPTTNQFVPLTASNASLLPESRSLLGAPTIAGTEPASPSEIPLDGTLAVRFSKPLLVESVNPHSVTLFGPSGLVQVEVVPAEEGLLAFVTPTADLLPAAQYTLFLHGVVARDGQALPFSALTFRTGSPHDRGGIAQSQLPREGTASAQTASGVLPSRQTSNSTGVTTPPPAPTTSADNTPKDAAPGDPDEEFDPGDDQYKGNWTTGRPIPDFARKPRLQNLLSATPGVTALTGQVLKLNDRPLAGVTLRIGQQTVQTDNGGVFLLQNISPGTQTLAIDATTAGPKYGYFEARVIINPGQTNVLPHTIWIPKLDKQNTVKIASPTVSAVVLTSPKLPGFAVVIPPGSVIRDRAGKIVTEIGLTPIPVDRPPFPMPALHYFPLFYTIQPAGAVIQSVDGQPKQAQVIYPNYGSLDPNRRVLFWDYDSVDRDWFVYGQGTVAPDGKSITPDPNVGIYQFSGFMHSPPNDPPPCPKLCCGGGPPGGPPGGPSPGGGGGGGDPMSPNAGDPVACGTGQFIHAHTDLRLNDVVPLTLRRVYESGDNTRHIFGLGTSPGLDYNIYTPTSGSVNQLVLVTPSGGGIVFTCTAGCSSYLTAQLQAQQQPGYFYSATMQYDGIEWLITTLDGTVFRIANAGAYLQSITDRFGNTTTYTRSTQQITKITTPNGRWIQFTYTGSVVTQASDNAGRTWNYTYDGFGRVVSATDPLNGVWQYAYNTLGMVTVTDPRNNTIVTNVYDANGRVQQQTYADSTTTTFAYTLDGSGNVTQTNVTDQRGNLRQIQFDSNGFVTSNTFALGKPEQQTTTFVRQANTNLLTSVTDALGRLTAYTYAANGNLASITRLSGTSNAVTTSYIYEPTYNQVVSVTDPLNHTTTATYDGSGNLIEIQDPNGNASTMTYNAQGQQLTRTNALNQTTSFTYDGGLRSSVTDPLNRTTTFYVDAVGRTVVTSDLLSNVWQTNYDALDRVTKVTDPLGNYVSYGYDANGNRVSFTDQKGNQTQYTFDAMNRLITREDALLNSETYAYDVASKLKQVTDRKAQVSGMTYDALNRQTQAGYGASTANPTAYQSTVAYTFDGGDRLTELADSQNGNITRSYDRLDRLASESTPQGTVSYTYDAAGRRATLAVPAAAAISYAWDAANRLTGITQGTQAVGFSYDNANRRTQVTLPDGININYAYDNAGQLSSITYVKGATTLGNLTYAYDAAGRRISVGGSFAGTNLPTAVATTALNANNQITEWGTPALSYDLNGNLTSDGTYSYTWDARDQLIQIQQGATVVASYQYDAFGRRRSKSVNSITTQFLYDRMNFVQEQDGTGNVTANLLVGLGADAPYARTKGATTSSFLTDHLGTIIAEADATGAIQTTYSYEPYGKTTQTGSASDNSQRYTGREQDTTDIYYYRARYYSPDFDRFVSEDPIGLKGGPNAYVYVAGDPASRKDPSGKIYLPGWGWFPDNPGPAVPEPPTCCDGEGLAECLAEGALSAAADCGLCIISIILKKPNKEACRECELEIAKEVVICLFKNCGPSKCRPPECH